MSDLASQLASLERFTACWDDALAKWSRYTQLRQPEFYASDQEAAVEDMAGQLAAIRLRDHRIMVNLATVEGRGLAGFELPLLAHEIGHHVYVPGNLRDHGRMIAAMLGVLDGVGRRSLHLCANLYADLLVNDRLQRRAGLPMAQMYAVMVEGHSSKSVAWQVYLRTYELLWRLPRETLVAPALSGEREADALLLSRIIRTFASDFLRGARRFAAVLRPYLMADEQKQRRNGQDELGLSDTRGAGLPGPAEAGEDEIPDGLSHKDDAELDNDDPLEDGPANKEPSQTTAARAAQTAKGASGGQRRTPFEYAQVLRALGLNLAEHDVAARYYREQALPHLLPFPRQRSPHATEPLVEGYEEWGAGDDLDALDLQGSVLLSPVIVPGVTTVRRAYGETPGAEPARVAVDLDLYIDCSGSMPNPSMDLSYLALCGAILTLSALRAGAKVQATLWSGPGQFETTTGFIRDERALLRIVTGYICGSTAFPLHVLRDTYAARKRSDPPVHIVVISDDGADTMLAKDEQGNDGATVCKQAIDKARGGGTLVLNLPSEGWGAREPLEKLGYGVHRVTDWEGLVAFARAFVQSAYGEGR